MRFALAILLTASLSAFSQTYVGSTFVGGMVPENLPAASISLGEVVALTADPAGNVFVASFLSSAVFRIDAATGMTRVAGNGTAGFSGDGGPATNAQLGGTPDALAVDLAGNLYIGDFGNFRIRKVTNGVITTVAGDGLAGFSGDGGPALSAQISPLGLATDAAGALYLLDESGVRKIANGIITSVPDGTGYYSYLAVDSAGTVYLSDGGPDVYTLANGIFSVAAGNGAPGFSGDNGPATSAELGVDYDSGCGVSGIAVDPAGNLYIADECNGRIRKVSNGIITTVAGGGSSSGNNIPATTLQLTPNLVAVDSAGDFYVAQQGTPGTTAIKVANGEATTIAGNGLQSSSGDNGPATSAQFNRPSGVAIDTAGRVYIADTANERVRMIANGVITTIAGTGAPGLGGDGGPAVNAQLNFPVGLALNAAGDLYIADRNNDRVRKVSQGIITTVDGAAGYIPCSVAADSTGAVYLYDCRTHQVLKVSNGTAATVAGNGTFQSSGDNGPATSAGIAGVNEMAVDASGNLYLADSGRIRKVSDGVITAITGGTGVTLDAAQNLYVADGNLGLIRKAAGGAFVAFPTSPATLLGQLDGNTALAGYGIAVDPFGNIYGSDGTRIVVLKSDGSVTPPTSASVDLIDNAASKAFAGIAPGEILTLIGEGLGPTQLVSAQPGDDGFYATQLAGTTVRFNGIAAPLLYTSATQVSAVAPYGVSGANTQVTVTYNGQSSVSATVAVLPAAPGVFTLDGSGLGQAAVLNQDGTLNSAFNPAPFGSIVSFYATGVGQTSPGGVDGQVATSPLPSQTIPVAVAIGGSLISEASYVQYAGAPPGEIAGVTQIDFKIPIGITTGAAVSFGIVVGNTSPSQYGVTIAVSRSGN